MQFGAGRSKILPHTNLDWRWQYGWVYAHAFTWSGINRSEWFVCCPPVLSMVALFLGVDDIDPRMGLVLTLILAINVFQLILSDILPKSGSLPMLAGFVFNSTLLMAVRKWR